MLSQIVVYIQSRGVGVRGSGFYSPLCYGFTVLFMQVTPLISSPASSFLKYITGTCGVGLISVEPRALAERSPQGSVIGFLSSPGNPDPQGKAKLPLC